METDDLIRALATDVAIRESPVERRFGAALAGGLAVTVALFLATLGLRPHLISLLGEPRIAFKFLVSLSLAIPAGLLVLRLTRPGTAVPWWVLGLAPILLVLASAAELGVVPSSRWEECLVGTYAKFCLISVPLLSLPLLAGALLALRHGAPTRPALAGVTAGLFAGGLAAAVYAMHCPDDSPLFVATWYTLAILIVAALGGILGPKVLRW
jgi:hypothetical protein